MALDAHILIVGAGRLGTRAAERLCAAGAKRITLCDYDLVLEENLEEQPSYARADIGTPKAQAAARHLNTAYPGTRAIGIPSMFSPEILTDDIMLIIDGTDNLGTRLTLNDAARARAVPLLIAAATKGRGMVFPVLPKRGAPCWQCISKGKVSADDCASGIDPVVADMVAQEQVRLALDILHDRPVEPELTLIDGARTAHIPVHVNPACEACRGHFEHLGAPFSLDYCASRERMIARPSAPRVIDLMALRADVGASGIIKEYASALLVKLGSGSALVHAHGQIEFSGVESSIAQDFAKRVLRVR